MLHLYAVAEVLSVRRHLHCRYSYDYVVTGDEDVSSRRDAVIYPMHREGFFMNTFCLRHLHHVFDLEQN